MDLAGIKFSNFERNSFSMHAAQAYLNASVPACRFHGPLAKRIATVRKYLFATAAV